MADKITLYHNPRCSKSRQALKLLQERGVEPEIVEYLKTPPGRSRIEKILRALPNELHETVRRKEPEYKKAGLTGDSSLEEVAAAIAEYPKILERPVAVRGSRAVLGRPPERVLEILKG